ncbi:hypothetical protein ACPYO6_14150 [Georgenia sp. Z1344]|uniref:hypothetical protein n=1 Tax=Georgenia sp. Z1344 TaxID=3416706 RepID=UPI003CF9B82B
MHNERADRPRPALKVLQNFLLPLAASVCFVLIAVVPMLILAWGVWPTHINYFPDALFCPDGYALANEFSRTYSEVGEDPIIDTRELCRSASGAVLDPGWWSVIWRETVMIGLVVVAVVVFIAVLPSRRGSSSGPTAPQPPVTQAAGNPTSAGPTTSSYPTAPAGPATPTSGGWASGPVDDLWGKR